MVLPLDLLIGSTDNRYELCAAAMRRAEQLNLMGDEEVERNKGKAVSTAILQILTKKVRYRLES